MGKKKEAAPEVEAPKKEAEGEDEDTPVIKELKGIDDKYCTIEVELEKEIEKLRKKYDERQAPLVVERQKVLSDTAAEGAAEHKEFGTPACPDFWIQALSNAGEFEELLHECDEPVLKYLDDIKKSYVDPEEPQKGARLEFTFKENPFFTNTTLWLEVTFDYDPATYKPYKECDCSAVKSCTIDWKAGKDITVEKKSKDIAGKKGKKKAGKAKEEPVPSFFRILFTSVKSGEPLPEGLECVYVDEDDEEDDLADCHLQNIGEVVQFMSQMFLPYAVRYYTGEASVDDDDDDDEESEEEDGDDDDDDESSEEPVAKGKKKAAPKKKSGGSGDVAEKGEKTEECKQQ